MCILTLGACLVLAAAAAAVDGLQDYEHIQEEFGAYKASYRRTYNHKAEEENRLKVYADNKRRIEHHNARYQQGLETYKMALNEYSDWLDHEFDLAMTGLEIGENVESASDTFISPREAIPEAVDWRREGAVTKVKNQGRCGSCWTFSSTGALEGQHFRKTGELVSLSEQHLIDCVPNTKGCHGGNMVKAFDYVKGNNGIDTETSYAYKATNKTCSFKPANVAATCSGYVKLPVDEATLMEAVATVGPVSVGIDAKRPGFRHYTSGVYYDEHCSKNPKHAVLVVGYGKTEEGVAYWLVKNSWGASWGLDGYIMMARDRDNNCAIASYAVYPTV